MKVKIPEECQSKNSEECPFLHWNCFSPHCNLLGKILKIDSSNSNPVKECTVKELVEPEEIRKQTAEEIIEMLKKRIYVDHGSGYIHDKDKRVIPASVINPIRKKYLEGNDDNNKSK